MILTAQNILPLSETILTDLKKELVSQGHRLTGGLEESLVMSVEPIVNGVSLVMRGKAYGQALNKGVPANRIPFQPGSGKKTSKYIDGITRFVELKGIASGKKAISIAFAIAKTHKKLGMPTREEKKGWIDKTIEAKIPSWVQLTESLVVATVNNSIQRIL